MKSIKLRNKLTGISTEVSVKQPVKNQGYLGKKKNIFTQAF